MRAAPTLEAHEAGDALAEDTEILDLAMTPSSPTTLPSGRRVFHSVDGSAEYVHVSDPAGRIEVTVRFGPHGPILEMSAVTLRLAARDVAIECETLKTNVARAITVACGGDVVETAHGKRHLDSAGGTRIAGRDVDVVAEAGATTLRATGDVSVQGATILLNC